MQNISHGKYTVSIPFSTHQWLVSSQSVVRQSFVQPDSQKVANSQSVVRQPIRQRLI